MKMARKRRSDLENARRAARSLPKHLQDVAFSKFSPKKDRARRLGGSFGAASEVRRINPETGLVIEDAEK